ncbi:MAG: GxxExxY protein [Chitinophagaceae bacterium]|nr:GxxExxY protein [Chitinophagaceae bacterium]
MHENEISYSIRGCIYDVFNHFGPGLLESVYEAALFECLSQKGLSVEQQVPVGVSYLNTQLPVGFRLDLLVEKKVIIEVKSVELLAPVHHKQLITYLKLTGCKLGILVNFNCEEIEQGIFRKVNGLC